MPKRAPADIACVLANRLRHSQPQFMFEPRSNARVPADEPAPDAVRRSDACVAEIQVPAPGQIAGVMAGVEVRRFGLKKGGATGAPTRPSGGDRSHKRGLLVEHDNSRWSHLMARGWLPEVTRMVENLG